MSTRKAGNLPIGIHGVHRRQVKEHVEHVDRLHIVRDTPRRELEELQIRYAAWKSACLESFVVFVRAGCVVGENFERDLALLFGATDALVERRVMQR